MDNSRSTSTKPKQPPKERNFVKENVRRIKDIQQFNRNRKEEVISGTPTTLCVNSRSSLNKPMMTPQKPMIKEASSVAASSSNSSVVSTTTTQEMSSQTDDAIFGNSSTSTIDDNNIENDLVEPKAKRKAKRKAKPKAKPKPKLYDAAELSKKANLKQFSRLIEMRKREEAYRIQRKQQQQSSASKEDESIATGPSHLSIDYEGHAAGPSSSAELIQVKEHAIEQRHIKAEIDMAEHMFLIKQERIATP